MKVCQKGQRQGVYPSATLATEKSSEFYSKRKMVKKVQVKGEQNVLTGKLVQI